MLQMIESQVFQGVCKLLNIDKTRTTAYHPSSDGMIERFNQTLQKMLATLVQQDQRDWDLKVPLSTMYYRSTEHRSTGETPNVMIFGRELCQPVDLMFKFLDETERPSAPEYVRKLQDRLLHVHKTAQNILTFSFSVLLVEISD